MAEKGLAGVIRLHKFQVDEKRRALAELQRREQQILDEQAALAAEMQAEIAAVRNNVELGRVFPAYAARHKVLRERVAAALTDIRRRIQAAQEDLAEAFLELKTFEITQANRDLRARKERERKDQVAQDEIGLMLHRRRGTGGGGGL